MSFVVSCVFFVEAFERCTQTDEYISWNCFASFVQYFLEVDLLEYNVYNESWEQFSLFLIEGSSARKKERERDSYAIIVLRGFKSFMKNSVVVIFCHLSFFFLRNRVSIKRKFREIFLSCTGIKSRKTVVRVYNYNRNRNFAITNLKKKKK